MSDVIETRPDSAPAAAGADMAEALLVQVLALDSVFRRAIKNARSLGDIRRALRAQARGRATFKILMALRAAAGDAKKFADSSEGTIDLQKIPCVDNSLERSASAAPTPGPNLPRRIPAEGKRLLRSKAKAGWSPERRARQALAIRTWQPWRKSTGPRTQDGKVRSARNALKHGCRSRPSIESRREDRRILRLSAPNIAAGKAFLRAVAVKREPNSGLSAPNGLHPAPSLSPNWYWPSLARADTVSRRIYPGIARTRGPAGAPGGSS